MMSRSKPGGYDMKKSISYFSAFLIAFSVFSSAEGVICKRKAEKIIQQAEESGQPYATGCTIIYYPGRGTIDFISKTTSDPNIFHLHDHKYLIAESGNYLITYGGRAEFQNFNDPYENVLVFVSRENVENIVANLVLPGVTSFEYYFELGDTVSFYHDSQGNTNNYNRTVFAVIQKLPEV